MDENGLEIHALLIAMMTGTVLEGDPPPRSGSRPIRFLELFDKMPCASFCFITADALRR